ncbi:carboxylating nicotinate-nucleotide diphosphorylase [Dehalococcoides mccartyi]|uniref:carboxylating nicotinate-nucleotide diphosphorylase n=1 Tax=Dehalococcoides mccartyi TaxID=61435 RepID=UPI0003C88450|nr:carboxylating nicotinate-nucleotide diphosphorylase [Dehalococcoides mccartyi]AHB13991.1 nicotinate-nucleotide pyrophosphorylase [Dehalococcoides mccartyi GY50]
MSQSQIEKIIDNACDEDFARGDVTTETLIPSSLAGRAIIIAKQDGIMAGAEVAKIVFVKHDPTMEIEILVEDGKKVKAGDVVMVLNGRVINILKCERTALNFLTHLSGIASLTAKYISKVEGLNVSLADTRKTIPGMRILEKYAVYAAGGKSNRPDLACGVLIKDNHLMALSAKGIGIKEAIEKAKTNKSKLPVTVEVNTLEQVAQAVEGAPNSILLDNMSVADMKKAVDIIPESIKIEASGNITLDNIREVAMTGVDVISVGALTHSAPALDFSLEFPIQQQAKE